MYVQVECHKRSEDTNSTNKMENENGYIIIIIIITYESCRPDRR